MQGLENPFLKSPTHWVLGFYLVLGFIGISDFFHLHEKLGIFLVDLAHQLSFYLHMTVL